MVPQPKNYNSPAYVSSHEAINWGRAKKRKAKSIDLLPCPFCGGRVSIEANTRTHSKATTHEIFCKTCTFVLVIADTPANAAKDWNTRV